MSVLGTLVSLPRRLHIHNSRPTFRSEPLTSRKPTILLLEGLRSPLGLSFGNILSYTLTATENVLERPITGESCSGIIRPNIPLTWIYLLHCIRGCSACENEGRKYGPEDC
jgi:hypothetical protein